MFNLFNEIKHWIINLTNVNVLSLSNSTKWMATALIKVHLEAATVLIPYWLMVKGETLQDRAEKLHCS